jgi:hypothetical protein
VVSAVAPETLEAHRDALADLAADHPLAVGGAAVSRVELDRAVLPLTGTPVAEAERLTHLARRPAERTP